MHNGVLLLQTGKFVRWKGNKSWSCKMWRIIKCLPFAVWQKFSLQKKLPFKLGQYGELQILCFLKTRKLHDSLNYRSSSSRKMVYKKFCKGIITRSFIVLHAIMFSTKWYFYIYCFKVGILMINNKLLCLINGISIYKIILYWNIAYQKYIISWKEEFGTLVLMCMINHYYAKI